MAAFALLSPYSPWSSRFVDPCFSRVLTFQAESQLSPERAAGGRRGRGTSEFIYGI